MVINHQKTTVLVFNKKITFEKTFVYKINFINSSEIKKEKLATTEISEP